MGGKVKGKTNVNKNLINNASSTESSSKKKKEIKKKKINTVKNTLANPFSLDWPSLNYKDYTDIKSLLQNALSVISKDYVSYQNERYLKRRESYNAKRKMKEPNKNCLPKSNAIICISNTKNSAIERISSNGLIIGHENLIFGYNAVMRGLEKGSVISVLVNNKTKPDLIVKMFIPICSVKLIPVIPIDDLSYIVKNAGIGIKSCLALGLKKSVTSEKNIFHPLYLKTCEALGFEASPSNIHEVSNLLTKETFETCPTHKPTKVKDKNPVRLSSEEIKRVHLYRNNDQERSFKPNQLKDNNAPSSSNILDNAFDFIRIGDVSDVPKSTNVKKKWQKPKPVISKLDASKLPSTSMFMIDSTGDSPDKNNFKACKFKISDEVKSVVDTNNFLDASESDDINASLFVSSSIIEEEEYKLTGKTKTHSSSFLECVVLDSTEKLNSSLIVSNECNERQQIAINLEAKDFTQVANSASNKSVMNKNNKKKRKFEEFSYVSTKVKRIKSSGKQKRAKK